MLKSDGLTTVPWGTPLRTGIGDDSTRIPISLIKATLWVRSPRKSTNPLNDVRVDATSLKLSFQP